MKLALKLPKIDIKLGGLGLGKFLKKRGTGLSVYATDKFLRVLELSEDKKPLFEPVEEFWEGKSQEEKVKILQRIVASNGLQGKEVVSCIGVDEGILKFQRFPASMPKKDLMEAIIWYINNETQQIKEETVYDYYFLEGEEGDRYVRVVVTIAKKKSVEELRDFLLAAGLKPKVIEYEIVSVINYGLINNLPPPFSILYVDYHESLLVQYSRNSIFYDKIDFNYKAFKKSRDMAMLDGFLIEVRNQLVINEISNIYLAGAVIADEITLENMMVNLPVLGILDLEYVPSSFFIPYTLSVEGLEG